jgi:hypothetical protein
MMTKPANTDRIEAARKILNAPASSLGDLEATAAMVSHVLAETGVELEEMAERRKAILASDAPTAEVDKQLERHDDAVRALTRRSEIASAISTKLATRIAADREAWRAAKQLAAYDEALELHVTATNRVKEWLDRIGPEARDLMREYLQSEMKTAAVNNDLPPGQVRIPSIEFERKGELQPPKVQTRHFKAFVYERRRIGEQGYVQAAPRSDGQWDVYIPGSSHSGGNYYVCTLDDFVDVVTETDDTPWPENLAEALAVPAFYVADRPAWAAVDSGSLHSIARALDKLESQTRRHFDPRVDKRLVTLAAWRAAGNEVAEVEPPQVLAAE